MQPSKFTKEAICQGMALSLPIDSKVELKHKFLQNTRITSDGFIRSRPRLTDLIDLDSNLDLVHIIRRLKNKETGTENWIIGAEDKIFTTQGSTTALLKDSGYSGKPLSIINFRPEQSLEPYAYIADKNKMAKISISNILADIGLNPPTKAIDWRISEPIRKVLDNITAATLADWVIVNGATSIVSRVNTTVSQFVPDSVILPDFASMVPVAFTAELQEGSIVTINGDDRIVYKVIPTGLAAGIATIAGIKYDTGTTGLCYLTLSVPVTEIYRDSILLLNGTEYVRVIDVIRGNDNIPVIRTKTIGTFIATNTVSGVASFRIFTSVSYSAGQTIVADGMKDVIAAAGISTLTKTANYDLTNANSKPLSDDALFHISLKVADQSKIIEIQIQLGFDTGFVDYLRYVITPNFLISSVTQSTSTIVAQQQALQRQEIVDRTLISRRLEDNQDVALGNFDRAIFDTSTIESITPDNQTTLGQNLWTELLIPFSSFTKIGADQTKTRKDIKAIRVSINASDTTDVYIDSIWIGGASGANSEVSELITLVDYNYIHRFRNPVDGTPSNWSPPLRQGLETKRDAIELSIPANSYPSNFKVDIARTGGNINDFRILASILNDGSKFLDDITDDIIADNEKVGRGTSEFSKVGDFDYFKPFAVLDKPKSGVCDVIGTEFTRTSGDLLDLSYPRGTEILINGVLTSFYSSPSTTSKVSLERNLGTLSGVKFEIKEPLLTGKPLPIIAGPFGEGFEGLVMFGAGDINAPGTVYWTDPNSFDTQSDLNNLEITAPTEPILAIVIYDSFPIVYTTKRSFALTPSQDSNGNLTFTARENANSKGLFGRKGVCIARSFIYQLLDDGIYRSEGVGNPQCITDKDLHSLFAHNGVVPNPITLFGQIIYPPNFGDPDNHWLFSTEDHVFWRFKDTNNKFVCLVWDTRTEGWISYDTYVGDKIGAIYKDEEEGQIAIYAGHLGAIKQFSIDSVTAFAGEDVLESKFIPFASDMGDFNLQKQFYEIAIDCKAGNGLKNIISLDNATVEQALVNIDVNANRDVVIATINNGDGLDGRNICNLLKWPLNAGTEIYRENFYFVPLAEIITNRSSDFEPEDIMEKFWQGVLIYADTFGEDKTLKYYNDDGSLKATLVINHNGRMVKSYSFETPFISHKIRRASDDDIEWLPLIENYIFDKEAELAKVWESQFTSYGIDGFKQIKLPAFALAIYDYTTVIFTMDNEELNYLIAPESVGVKKVYRFHIEARKWKLLKIRLESPTAFRNYKNDAEILIRKFNGQEDFQVIKPFGNQDNLTMVQI